MKFPAPAVGLKANTTSSNTAVQPGSSDTSTSDHTAPSVYPGKLPDSATGLSNGARGLLCRLLEKDPRVRMRNLRQLQQCAFYMGFNFEHIKAKKVQPKSVLMQYFPNGAPEGLTEDIRSNSQAFLTFDQPSIG